MPFRLEPQRTQSTKNNHRMADYSFQQTPSTRATDCENPRARTMTEIIPAIDVKTRHEFVQNLKKIHTKKVHVDVMDGVFVQNTTVPIAEIKNIKNTVKYIIHLMVADDQPFVDELLTWKNVDTIIIHPEGKKNLLPLIHIIKHKKKVGLALKPKTSVQRITPYLSLLDEVLVMTVEPGMPGQAMTKSPLRKIAQLTNVTVSVDGGINTKTAPIAARAGADVLYATSAVFGEKSPKQALRRLREAVSQDLYEDPKAH